MSRANASVKRRRLMVESLESRDLMAGNVIAEMVQGDLLRITGNALANGVEIRQLPMPETEVYEGVKLEVIGTPVAASPNGKLIDTTINSKNSVIFTGVKGLTVALGDGRDILTIGNPQPPRGSNAPARQPQVVIPGTFDVRMGDGDDDVTLFVVNPQITKINLGNGDDRFQMTGSTVRGLRIFGDQEESHAGSKEDGHDSVTLRDLVVEGETIIALGKGDDSIEISGKRTIFRRRFDLSAGDGKDSIKIDPKGGKQPLVEFGNHVGINSGSGADRVYIRGTQSSGHFLINTSYGDDRVYIHDTQSFGQFSIQTDEGGDDVEVFRFAGEEIFVYLGVGDDRLVVGGFVAKKTAFEGFHGRDEFFSGDNFLPGSNFSLNGFES